MARLTIDVQMRWSDIDGYQHVNNARMFTLLEEARIAAFWASTPGDKGFEPVGGGVDPAHATPGTKVLDTGPGSGTNTYIARQEIEYLAPLPYTLRPVPVQLWISHLGGASLDICYEIPGPDGPAARAMTTLVLIDEETERPRRMTAAERESWSHYLDDPVPFRRRPTQAGPGPEGSSPQSS